MLQCHLLLFAVSQEFTKCGAFVFSRKHDCGAFDDSGDTIGADIPPSKNEIVTATFTPGELQEYDGLTTHRYHKLITLSREKKLVWNMRKYRQLALLTTWLGFQYVHSSISADNMPNAMRRVQEKTLLIDWLNHIAEKKGFEEPFPSDSSNPDDPEVIEKQLNLILGESPRMRALLPLIIK